jgi:hypothetical protein
MSNPKYYLKPNVQVKPPYAKVPVVYDFSFSTK